MISQIQVKAKANDEKTRMLEAAIAIDFYNFRQRALLLAALEQLYPKTYQDIGKYIRPVKIVQTIIDQTAILFQSPPSFDIESPKDTDAEKAKYEATSKLLNDVLAAAEIHKKLIVTDRMAELHGKTGIAVHWHDIEQRVVLDILTPDRTIVKEDPLDPTKAEAVYYCVGTSQAPGQSAPVNRYAKWTRDEYYECELNADMKEGKIFAETRKPNRYGIIPVAWFYTMLELDSFWVDHGYVIVEDAVNIAIRECNLDIALDYQSFSTLVGIGLDKSLIQEWGIQRYIAIDNTGKYGDAATGDAKYITPDAKLTEVSDIINQKKVSVAKDSHLSASAFNQDNSNITSGYQLRLTEKQLEEHNNLKKEVYRPELIKLIKLIIMCYNMESTGTQQIPADANVFVTFSDRKFAANPVEITATQLTKIQAGLMSVADAIRENNPDLTQEQAIEESKRIKAEMAELNGTAITPILDEDLG